MRVTILAVLATLSVACSSSTADRAAATRQPLLGNPDGSDASDTACNVVLRELHVAENRGAVEQDCPAGGAPCFVVVRGTVDVSNAAIEQGAYPMLLWQAGGGPWNVAPVPTVAGGVVGFERHAFAFDGFDANQPWPSLQVIPYLVVGGGSRLFDHNQNRDPFANYAFDPNAQLAVQEDAAVCPGAWPAGLATASFAVGWTDALSGTLVQGGKLTVDYDLGRQPQCESSTYNGLPAWNTEAYVRFDTGGATLAKSVRGPQDAQGRWTRELFTVDVPAGAAQVSLWFETSGETCATSWDSNWGANWTFPVQPAP
jgi:hypothetical protein